MARSFPDRTHLWLVDQPATPQQSRSAAIVAAVTFLAFCISAPFAGMPLAELNAFFPALDAIVFVTDTVTAVLLFGQFRISGLRALLILASGYLFTALIVIPHALTFRGAFSPGGLLGAGIQTGSWLFIFWHVGFAIALLVYALFRRAKCAKPMSEASRSAAFWGCLAGVCSLVYGLTWLATGGEILLPAIIIDDSSISPLVIYPIWFTISILATALVLLVDRCSVLDRWLLVVCLVSILELVFSGLLPSIRFSLGFYVGRMYSLVISSIVLIVLLAETTRLYMRVARSHALLLRERDNKLLSARAIIAAIAHEVRQPLAAISIGSNTALRRLERTPPDCNKIRADLNRVIAESHRASDVFDGFQAMFGRSHQALQHTDINEIVIDALQSCYEQLKDHGIETHTELTSRPLLAKSHRGQLYEVVVNLVANAIEAMDSPAIRKRVLAVKTEFRGPDAIVVSV
jgi:signal transduction histidine kinase